MLRVPLLGTLAVVLACGVGTNAAELPRDSSPGQIEKGNILDELRAVAIGAARRNGETHPSDVRVFRTTRATANELLAQAQVDTDQAVYVVMMRGNFVVKRGPPGGNFPTGTELWVAWDPARKVGTDFGVGNGYPRWAQLGPGLSLDLE